MKSKTKIKERARRKSRPGIVETIRIASKNSKWNGIAIGLSGSRKNYVERNLDYIDEKSKEGDTIVVIGKVLGTGTLSKKVRICALGFSKEAKEKIKKSKSDAVSILDEIKSNSKAEGIKVL